MPNRIKLTFIYVLTIFSLNAQIFEYDNKSKEEQLEIDRLGERLVELALLYSPDYNSVVYNSDIAKEEKRLAKHSWLDLMFINGNINESIIDPPSQEVIGNANLYYPRYNLGFRMPMGIFVNQSGQNRIAEKRYQISQLNIEKAEASIRKEVMVAYNNYLLQKDLYNIKVQITEESKAFLSAKENSFVSGEIDLLEYNAAIRTYQKDLESLLGAQNSFKNAELLLEQWIGVDLEEVSTE